MFIKYSSMVNSNSKVSTTIRNNFSMSLVVWALHTYPNETTILPLVDSVISNSNPLKLHNNHCEPLTVNRSVCEPLFCALKFCLNCILKFNLSEIYDLIKHLNLTNDKFEAFCDRTRFLLVGIVTYYIEINGSSLNLTNMKQFVLGLSDKKT